ncbi:hypothetical protein AB990_02440, partial [Alkalihalobacillus pseudalcaliphilus]
YIKIFILVALMGASITVVFPETIESLMQRLDGGVNLDNEMRVIIWKAYLSNWYDYILFGELHGDYRKYMSTGHGPHNVLINWTLHFGILALIGFITIIVGIIITALKAKFIISKSAGAAIFTWLMAYLSVALINETGFDHLSLFAAIGIILSLEKILTKANLEN